MKLSSQTITLLKNFAAINPSLSFKAGQDLETVSPQKNILVEAGITEDISNDFAIYELNRFLGVLGLFKDPELNLGETSLSINADGKSVSYMYADPSMIITPPKKKIVFPDAEVTFDLEEGKLTDVIRGASVLQLPELVVVGDGKNLSVVAKDTKTADSSDVFQLPVGETDGTFSIVFKIENIQKLLSGTYSVSLSSKRIGRFVHKDLDLTYYVASEASSKYEG